MWSEKTTYTMEEYKRVLAVSPSNIVLIDSPAEELCWFILKADPNSLEFIAEPTFDMCDYCIKISGNTLRFVPNKYITQELCNIAVDAGNDVLWFVPYQFITQELCLKAINKNPFQIWKVPYTIYNFENLFLEAVKIDGLVLSGGSLDKVIHWDFFYEKIALAAIIQNWKALAYVLWSTDEMHRVALLQSLEAAKYMHPSEANEIINSLIRDNPDKYSEKDLIPYEI
jgi:hypothetical protein